ncbi:MAG: nucleotidyltransferase domain-containing protein [archaeon]
MFSTDYFRHDKLLVMGLVANQNTSLRALAKKANLAPSSAHKILSNLKKNKMICKKRTKNKVFFSINYDSPLAREAIRASMIAQILQSKGFRKLLSLKPNRAYLFGSASTGRVTPTSDIDIAAFFVLQPGKELINFTRNKLSEELDREIDLFILDEKSSSSKDEKTETLKTIENSILLYGKK